MIGHRVWDDPVISSQSPADKQTGFTSITWSATLVAWRRRRSWWWSPLKKFTQSTSGSLEFDEYTDSHYSIHIILPGLLGEFLEEQKELPAGLTCGAAPFSFTPQEAWVPLGFRDEFWQTSLHRGTRVSLQNSFPGARGHFLHGNQWAVSRDVLTKDCGQFNKKFSFQFSVAIMHLRYIIFWEFLWI